MTQKNKVEIHVIDKSHILLISFLENVMKDKNIEYSIVIDTIKYHRSYPYITVNNRVTCIKRVILQKRAGYI